MNAPIEVGYDSGLRPGRLWSLLDMLKALSAKYLVELGEEFDDLAAVYHHAALDPESPLTATELGGVQEHLEQVHVLCTELNLRTSQVLISSRLDKKTLPKTLDAFEMLRDAVMAELENRYLVHVDPERIGYFLSKKIVVQAVRNAFPLATLEIESAGVCFTFEEWAAAVFHAMRAVEIGLQAMGRALGVDLDFGYPIELAELGKIIEKLEPKVSALRQPPRSAQKDADLEFYSTALSQFRHFNNGWRIRVAHARATYKEAEAKEVIDHVKSFFETLATRLKE